MYLKEKDNLQIFTFKECLRQLLFLGIVSGNIYLIKNVQDIVVMLGLKVFNYDNSYMFSCRRNAQITFVETTGLK